MEALAQLASAAIALLALGVSIGVAMKQAKIAREQTRIAEEQARIASEQTAIQERLAAIEEARRADEVEARGRARVTASIQTGTDKALVLHNQGLALARGVAVEVENGPRAPEVLGLEILPVDLQPGQPMPFHIIPLSMGDDRTLRLTVRWTDEGGEHEAPYTLQL